MIHTLRTYIIQRVPLYFSVITTFLSLLIVVVFIINVWVKSSTQHQVYTNIDLIPAQNVALLLGTSKYTREGKENPFFRNRIDAATQLYKKHKVKHLVLSGDNSLSYYNEPMDMRKALLERGVPDSVITLDFAGFRTFDSVVRCKKIFGQDHVIIVTQSFHLYRALFIANHNDIESYGFAAEAVEPNIAFTTLFREYFARCLAVLDLFIFKESPKFLGKKEDIHN